MKGLHVVAVPVAGGARAVAGYGSSKDAAVSCDGRIGGEWAVAAGRRAFRRKLSCFCFFSCRSIHCHYGNRVSTKHL